jgi:excisionase family DNA binding protein
VSTTQTLNATGKALLTVQEAADMIHLSVSTLRRYIDRKMVATCKPGGKMGKVFIRPADLDAFLNRTRRAAIGE